MVKIKKTVLENHTDHPYDNGAIDAIASVASVGAAVGAGLGIAAGISGIVAGVAVGGALGALVAIAGAEEMEHPGSIIPPNK
jgi:hypothetical protein